MNEILRGVVAISRVQSILVAWFMPILLPAFAFTVFVLPEVDNTTLVAEARDAAAALNVNRTIFVLIVSLASAVFLSLNRRALYRTLEGLTWPRFLRDWRVARAHRPWHAVLVGERGLARAQAGLEDVERRLTTTTGEARRALEEARQLHEQHVAQFTDGLASVRQTCKRRGRSKGGGRRLRPLLAPRRPSSAAAPLPYPEDPSRLMPTCLGNALKRMETYGITVYGFDSQTLWFELRAASDPSLRAASDEAELDTDTFLCALLSAWALAIAALVATPWSKNPLRLLVLAGLALAMARVLNRGLLAAVDNWGRAIRAMVNTALPAVQDLYCLPRPADIDEQKRMWGTVTGVVSTFGEPILVDQFLALQAQGRLQRQSPDGRCPCQNGCSPCGRCTGETPDGPAGRS